MQASGYGAAANQPNVGFQQGGGNYSHAQSSKYQGGGGYCGQGGLYGNPRMRGDILAIGQFCVTQHVVPLLLISNGRYALC